MHIICFLNILHCVGTLHYLATRASHLLLVLIHYTHSPTCQLNFPLLIAVSSLPARCYAHFIWHMHRIQLLKELSCRVSQQSTNSWKGFMQQVPFQTARKYAEDKCLMQPLTNSTIQIVKQDLILWTGACLVCNIQKLMSYSSRTVVRIVFNSVKTWNCRTPGTGLQKMACYSIQCCYMML